MDGLISFQVGNSGIYSKVMSCNIACSPIAQFREWMTLDVLDC